MQDLDRIIHEPARLRILMLLAGVESADFTFLLNTLGMTSGNLSSHLDRLEKSGYVEVKKSFDGKMPNTDVRLSASGRTALDEYWKEIDQIRGLATGHEWPSTA
jgi:DNA-binding transcriptional ArsR family regulator